ncbi:MAG: clostripain-related cysteine peptidase [Phycisphaerales bacterium]
MNRIRTILPTVIMFLLPEAAFARLSLTAASPPKREWVLVYYMSYDNDLERHGPGILEALERGTKGTNLIVTVLADDADQSGLRRYTLSNEGRGRELLGTDDSASEEVLSDYLTWVATHHPAKHYAVVFLDHGGRLDEMCLDERPGRGREGHWLSARRAGGALREFRKEIPGEFDLLFLQQCGRGSIENLYNFRGTAKAVMASQMNVGAPNTYYESTLRWLAEHQDATGPQLARQVMDTDEHYAQYVCVNGPSLEEIPSCLKPVVEALLGTGDSPGKAPGLSELTPCFQYEGETNYDLFHWLERAFNDNHRSTDSLREFRKWVQDELIVTIAVPLHRRNEITEFCGLSLYVPVSQQARGSWIDYPFYEGSRLRELWTVIYPPDRSAESR